MTKTKSKEDKGYGLWRIEAKDWMYDNGVTGISTWATEQEAESFRKNHTVHPANYRAKKI
jgi:hypothetical protein